jgi:hypothetical protein
MAMDLASDDLMVLVCSRIDITYSKANKSVLRIRDVFFRTQTPDPTIFHPGSGSWIQTLTFTHPGSRDQKGNGSQIRIRNTACKKAFRFS